MVCYYNALQYIHLSTHIAYHIPNWRITTRAVKTNNCANVFCRAPGKLCYRCSLYTFCKYLGTLEGIFIIESIVEHISQTIGVPSEIVKQKNLYEKGQVMLK